MSESESRTPQMGMPYFDHDVIRLAIGIAVVVVRS
eukprot:CAMPEP_0181105554 /NCGR_PEP_ID=MMETSP1071-20121207/16049_1 /TAXON_ID=35127 /ORGANISM="Thalassiosira sp., Strain NH16" /LENGTH=34 /DNA_ID= /DNA_START= /DNA_END= /DNA_ORIENTATION=